MAMPPPIRMDVKTGAFEMSIAVLKEAASLASSVPYLGAVAGIFQQIIRIKAVSLRCCCCFFPSSASRRELWVELEFFFFRKSIFIARCGKR
jgi:hypothetical protein